MVVVLPLPTRPHFKFILALDFLLFFLDQSIERIGFFNLFNFNRNLLLFLIKFYHTLFFFTAAGLVFLGIFNFQDLLSFIQLLFEQNLISKAVDLLLISVVDAEFIFLPHSRLHGRWHLAFLVSG